MSASADSSDAKAPRDRLDGIELLRGVACLLVVSYHLGMYVVGAFYVGWDAIAQALPWWSRWLLVLPRMGYLGVPLFLVLSGFCLAWPYVGSRSTVPLPTGAFLRARALRILPPYYASLLLLWAIASRGGAFARIAFHPVEAWDVGIHALLLHNLSARTLWSINGAYWSLALEAQLYLAFLVVLPAFRRSVGWTLFVGLLVSSSVPVLLAHTLKTPSSGAGWAVVHESMPAHLFEFVCGVLAAQLVATRRVVARALLLVLSPLWVLTGFAATVWHVWPSPLDKILYGISFGALVMLVARWEMGTSRLGRLLLVPGTVSYSLYLLHQPAILLVAPYVWLLRLSARQLWLGSLAVGLPALVLLGMVGHAVLERPFLRGGTVRRWLLKENGPDPRPTTGAT